MNTETTSNLTTIEKSYKILESLRLDNNLYLASSSSDYNFVWLRDSFYEVLPYLDKPTSEYEDTYHAILDILNEHSWKFDPCFINKPVYPHEYIHPRYTVAGKEVQAEWGNCQHDAIGAILFGIAKGEKAGKRIIRDKKDRDTIQNIVFYLNLCEYWHDPDNGMWEEGREVHASSLGAVVAGLREIQDYVTVSDVLIQKGVDALNKLLPNESESKRCDLAQLSLIYPYNVVNREQAWHILLRIEKTLLKDRGVIRYRGDSYFNSDNKYDRDKELAYYFNKEAEWSFGLPWLSLCYLQLGHEDTANYYIKRTEAIMLNDGALPELYFAGTNRYNENTPLGWSSGMYIMAIEGLERANWQKREPHVEK